MSRWGLAEVCITQKPPNPGGFFICPKMPKKKNHQFYLINRIGATGQVREVNLEGTNYLVVPCVPVREAVLNQCFVPGDEIAAFVEAWNGIPLPLGHPMANGEYISANTPELAARVAGRMYYTDYDEEARTLHAEMWIDIAQCEKLGGDAITALQKLRNGEPVELSTAYFCDVEMAGGEYNGAAYTEVAHNLRPDHLAILLNEEGACNWAMGCGAPRVNALDMEDALGSQLDAIYDAWYEQHKDDDGNLDSYVVSIFEDYVVVRYGMLFYKAAYTVSDEGEISFGELVEVEAVYLDPGEAAGIGLETPALEGNAYSNSSMIAFKLPDEIAAELAETLTGPAGDAIPEGCSAVAENDLHLTLYYAGDLDEVAFTEEEITTLVESFAADMPAIKGEIGGCAVFSTQGDRPALVLLFDSPLIREWQLELLKRIDAAFGIRQQPYGFIPHITLAELPEGCQTCPAFPIPPRTEITFDQIGLYHGNNRQFFDLIGGWRSVLSNQAEAAQEASAATVNQEGSMDRDQLIQAILAWPGAEMFFTPELLASFTDEQLAAIYAQYEAAEPEEEPEAMGEEGQPPAPAPPPPAPAAQEVGSEAVTNAVNELFGDFGGVQGVTHLLSNARNAQQAERRALIDGIMANVRNAFTREMVEAMPEDTLRATASMLRDASYEGAHPLVFGRQDEDGGEWEYFGEVN